MKHFKISTFSSKLLLVTITLVNFLTIHVTAESTAVVHTTTGPVQGEILDSVNSVKYATFKGIPYAKPPVGNLRFKPPVAIDPWTKTLDATVEGSDCMQPAGTDAVGSEDCLYLNVYTTTTDLSETPKNLKPVMFWIFGGGFITGTSSSRSYRPDYLLERGVVYVAPNYRLGAFGFLGMDHPNATGNAGLKDQVLALKWVKSNIEKFGGNPNNVTIFGQSAGSASAGYHILSEASIGLFHGAISMSGVPLTPFLFMNPTTAMSRAVQLGAHLGTISTNKEILLKTFYNASAEEIVKATEKVFLGLLPFVPTLEDPAIATDVFLAKCSVVKYITGNFTKVPQMLGFNDQETMTFVSYVQPFINTINATLKMYEKFGMTLPDSLDGVAKLIETSSDFLGNLSDNTLSAVINETTDFFFKSEIDLTQKFLEPRNDGKPIFYYHASFYTNRSLHNINSNNTLLGAGHSDDLAYIFYYPRANYSNDPSDPTRRTINRVSSMWTNFAKYGDPTPHWINDNELKVKWPNSGILGLCLDIGTELTVGLRPINDKTKLVQSASLPYLDSANGC